MDSSFLSALLGAEEGAAEMARVKGFKDFKTSESAQPEKYHPIGLVQIGYKLFATITLERLNRIGAEERLGPTQFGFPSGSCNLDAFSARRVVEETWKVQDGHRSLIALD